MAQNYRAGGYGYGHAKLALLEKMENYFAPYRDRYNALIADEDALEEALEKGAKRVRPVVDDVMERARSAVGVGRG